MTNMKTFFALTIAVAFAWNNNGYASDAINTQSPIPVTEVLEYNFDFIVTNSISNFHTCTKGDEEFAVNNCNNFSLDNLVGSLGRYLDDETYIEAVSWGPNKYRKASLNKKEIYTKLGAETSLFYRTDLEKNLKEYSALSRDYSLNKTDLVLFNTDSKDPFLTLGVKVDNTVIRYKSIKPALNYLNAFGVQPENFRELVKTSDALNIVFSYDDFDEEGYISYNPRISQDNTYVLGLWIKSKKNKSHELIVEAGFKEPNGIVPRNFTVKGPEGVFSSQERLPFDTDYWDYSDSYVHRASFFASREMISEIMGLSNQHVIRFRGLKGHQDVEITKKNVQIIGKIVEIHDMLTSME
ncbi:hypothetical protein OOT55_16370 [Marinimicrobium sp. C6131]|uniref:hypothetical protein n=1 Tax=Marinimicrobium sp. C6131 TaxID=3022676 RepID=UPI00223DAEBD|nr:hypothetical protein [Marinimicrobium sp. C6131]UZJ44216.1 hypothetical protein OOT55_16370 [Marinimicrobium sp. C6131]